MPRIVLVGKNRVEMIYYTTYMLQLKDKCKKVKCKKASVSLRPAGFPIVTLICQLPYKGNNRKASWTLTWNNPRKRTIDNNVVGV